MALDLHISGPGLDLHRRLEAGEPALILGRDSECAVCLPDPDRSISRRHLSVWNEGERLHFHVLSVVNGVEAAEGELPPGARGVLVAGEMLGLSAFRLHVTALAPPPAASEPRAAAEDAGAGDDPWSEFARQAEQLVPGDHTEAPPVAPDDPFGDWGFQSTFGPGSPAGSLRADALAAATDLEPFFAGLGAKPGAGGGLTRGELETIGRLARIALQGLLLAAQAAAAQRPEMRAGDAAAAPTGLHPLREDTPLDAKLQYLLAGAPGALPPERALAQVAAELLAHQQAMAEAVPEAMHQLLDEFDPEVLKKRLLGAGTRIFKSARAWDAFVKEHAQRSADADAWLRALLERPYARAYARAIVRAKRNTAGRPQP